MENIPDKDKYVICPLDKHHCILKHRLPGHLIKCEQNHDMSNKIKCSFNSTHIVDKSAIEHHHANCPDTKSFYDYTYNTDGKQLSGVLDVKDIIRQQNNFADEEESWDTPISRPGYDPFKNSENKAVFRQLPTSTSKSGRKAFREAERKRHAELDNITVPRYVNDKKLSKVGESSTQLRPPNSNSQAMLSSSSSQTTSTSIKKETDNVQKIKIESKDFDQSNIENISDNFDKIKLNDDKIEKEKFDNEFPKLGEKFIHVGNDKKKSSAVKRNKKNKKRTVFSAINTNNI